MEVVGQRSEKDVVVAVAVEPDEIDRTIAKRIAYSRNVVRNIGCVVARLGSTTGRPSPK